MKLRIDYAADYQYEEPVSLSPHLARILPRTDLFVKVEHKSFSTAATADVQFRRDLSDNLIGYCFYPELVQSLPFRLTLELEVEERNPFHFLLDSRGLHIPCDYSEDERAILQAFLRTPELPGLPAPLAPNGRRPTVETLVTMNQWIHENFDYERRDEGDPFEPAETLRRASGSCRDYAVFFAEVLRLNGVAARLASGFVWEGDRAEADRRAASAMHAWVEACLPGAGWVGLDPTNGVFCDHHFITTAVGLRHGDVSPIAGTYYGKKKIASELTTRLSVEKS
ncbi:MAG: transglutaminase family protein [Terrimicrobiaceae bacterium]|nr:transglutaminase family protein [Terrimicrobiaceae bacterium]